jgi:DNA polymerase III delta subunit
MEPAELFAHLAGLVRRLLIVKELVAQRRPLAAEAASFGLSASSYVQQKLQRQALNFSYQELECAYDLLRSTDVAIKTGRIDPELGVELAVAEIVGIGSGEGDGIAPGSGPASTRRAAP